MKKTTDDLQKDLRAKMRLEEIKQSERASKYYTLLSDKDIVDICKNIDIGGDTNNIFFRKKRTRETVGYFELRIVGRDIPFLLYVKPVNVSKKSFTQSGFLMVPRSLSSKSCSITVYDEVRLYCSRMTKKYAKN